MSVTQIREELEYRINNDTKFFGGHMPERFAIAWRSYLAALLEWGTIDVGTHHKLRELVPNVEDDPVVAIMMGREDTDGSDPLPKSDKN